MPTRKAIEVTCCTPVTGAVLDEDDAAQLAASFKALSDPVRLRLLSLVAASGTGEICACDLVTPVGRSNVYSLCCDAIAEPIALLSTLANTNECTTTT